MKELVYIPTTTEPARRHKCDLCKTVFECHLCMIGNDHDLHTFPRTQVDTETPILICEECIMAKGLWIVVTGIDERHPVTMPFQSITFYDHLTGERIK